MNMLAIAIVVALVACASHGRRVLTSLGQPQRSARALNFKDAVNIFNSDSSAEAHETGSKRRACEKVTRCALLALNPRAAFNALKLGPVRRPLLAPAHSLLPLRTCSLPTCQRSRPPVALIEDPSDAGNDYDQDFDDDDYYSARLLSPDEQAAVLDDWMSRTRIYRMSREFGNEDLGVIHTEALENIEALRSFKTSPYFAEKRSGRMVLGLFDKQEVWAVAAGEVSKSKGFVVQYLVVNPIEVNNLFDEGAEDLDESGAVQGILSALDELAENMGVPLDISPLNDDSDDDYEDDWETGSRDYFSARLLSRIEQETVLDDWIVRTRIYSQIGNFGGDERLAEVHRNALQWLVPLREMKISPSVTLKSRSGNMLVALNDDDDRIRGLASAVVSKNRGLLVTRLVIEPSEVNVLWESGARGYGDSRVVSRMVSALTGLASTMGLSMDIKELDSELLADNRIDDEW